MPHDDLLAALVRAIAWEMIQLGYRPNTTRAYVQQIGKEPIRVADETWEAMNVIMAGKSPDGFIPPEVLSERAKC
jgi:hypothetical protein